MKFLDQVKVNLRSGKGGPGAVSFRREANVPFGGPDGGDGGRGGDVIAECVDSLNTLIDYRYKQHFKAESGKPGSGRNRSGPDGKSAILKLPLGTQIFADDNETLITDLVKIGQTETLLQGGRGGKGNAWFKSSVRQSPKFSQPGEVGEDIWVWLRLKLIADAGLIGMPNAGKSTLLSKVSSAKPKIADYPFTTLYPGLGVVNQDDKELVIADIPGLIKGAHQGLGLGIRFLGHVERCRVLFHLVDCCDENPVKSWETVQNEIKSYGAGLSNKYCITVLTKCDALIEELNIEIAESLRKNGAKEVVCISSLSGMGIKKLLRQAIKVIEKLKRDEFNNYEN